MLAYRIGFGDETTVSKSLLGMSESIFLTAQKTIDRFVERYSWNSNKPELKKDEYLDVMRQSSTWKRDSIDLKEMVDDYLDRVPDDTPAVFNLRSNNGQNMVVYRVGFNIFLYCVEWGADIRDVMATRIKSKDWVASVSSGTFVKITPELMSMPFENGVYDMSKRELTTVSLLDLPFVFNQKFYHNVDSTYRMNTDGRYAYKRKFHGEYIVTTIDYPEVV
jgi:hypothetical protein